MPWPIRLDTAGRAGPPLGGSGAFPPLLTCHHENVGKEREGPGTWLEPGRCRWALPRLQDSFWCPVNAIDGFTRLCLAEGRGPGDLAEMGSAPHLICPPTQNELSGWHQPGGSLSSWPGGEGPLFLSLQTRKTARGSPVWGN